MGIDWSLWINIIGLLLGVISIVLGIDYFKRKRYPGRISFIQLNSINLIDDIVKNFDEISILHNNRNVKENIIYYKGCFINTGEIDITRSLIEKNLSLSFTNNKWLKIKSTNSSDGLKCEARLIDEATVEFDFNLLRKNEFFEFEALIELNSDADKHFNPNINHRIANTEKIKRIDFVSKRQLKSAKNDFIGSIIFSAFVILMGGFAIYQNLTSEYFGFHYISANKTFSASPDDKETIILKDIQEGTKKKISINDFQNKETYTPVIYIESKKSMSLIIFIITVVMFGIIVFPLKQYLSYKKQKKILEILSIDK
jgi:hypothetical protein